MVRVAVLAPVLLTLVVSPRPAVGSEGPTLFGRSVHEAAPMSDAEIAARRLHFESMLEERGWEVHGDVIGPPELFADPPGPQAATPAPEGWEFPPHRATIYLNFFGGPMTNGTNAARMESTCISAGTFDYPGFTGSEAQALAIIETFESQLAPYGVRIAYEEAPPPELPYAMVMMGGTPQMIGMANGVLGVSCSSDCGDRWWRDATFAFTAAASPGQTNTLATTALHEAAHAFGLAHIDTSFSSGYIMHPYVDNSERVWSQGCIEYNDATGGINCKSTHDIFCGGGAQNSHAELLAFFGTNSPDTVPPTVEITTPEDGIELAIGSDVTVEAEVSDDHDGVGWKFMIYQDGVLVDERPAFVFEKKWTLSGLPQGVYTLRVQAIDHDRNLGADEVNVYVGAAPPAGSTGGETDGDETDGDTATPTTGGGESEGAGSSGDTGLTSATVGATAGEGADEEGCACASDPAGRGRPLLLVGLVGLLARRRR